MHKLVVLTLLASLALAHPARATTNPSVAVMPFKDLSGGRGNVGEAIRETVTTDLKDVAGVRVIERSAIDHVLAEQNLQAARADLDPLTTVKVGKLLGATLIVAGAYQKAASTVRLTARFVSVETGEIVGTAKVDGAAAELLRLQDQVTAELVKSAGLGKERAQKIVQRARPKLRSYRAVELYGDAVVEKDEQKKVEILKLALNEDPGFVYASRDLDELEQRLKQYDNAWQREADKAVRELKQQVSTEKDPQKLMIAYVQLFAKLQLQRRWRTLYALSRDVVKNPPPAAPPPFPNVAEMAQLNIVQCLQTFRDWDGVLREGERFVATWPQSNSFTSVRALLDSAIEKKRTIAEGVNKAKQEIAALDAGERGDACVVGQKYQSSSQYKDARAQYEKCLQGPTRMPKHVVYSLLVATSLELGDFAAVRRWLGKLKDADPELYRSMSALEQTMPADG